MSLIFCSRPLWPFGPWITYKAHGPTPILRVTYFSPPCIVYIINFLLQAAAAPPSDHVQAIALNDEKCRSSWSLWTMPLMRSLTSEESLWARLTFLRVSPLLSLLRLVNWLILSGEEPLLKESLCCFVLFPNQYHEVRNKQWHWTLVLTCSN